MAGRGDDLDHQQAVGRLVDGRMSVTPAGCASPRTERRIAAAGITAPGCAEARRVGDGDFAKRSRPLIDAAVIGNVGRVRRFCPKTLSRVRSTPQSMLPACTLAFARQNDQTGFARRIFERNRSGCRR